MGLAPRGRAARPKDQRNQVSKVKSEPAKENRKRKAATEPMVVESDTNARPSPSKRQRTVEAPNELPEMVRQPKIAQAEKSTKASRRYGKKGKASSPAPNLAISIDFDELPGSTAPKRPISPLPPKRGKNVANVPTVIEDSRKTRASAVQRKDKKADIPMVTAVKPEKKPLKTRPKRGLKVNKPQEEIIASVVERPKPRKALPLKETQTVQVSEIST